MFLKKLHKKQKDENWRSPIQTQTVADVAELRKSVPTANPNAKLTFIFIRRVSLF